ncbi:tripartite motif-containing protein 2 isoform X3 [Folsomia candida]|uniref:tripartite motif-containing protein 2 isoform X3 n=1 Tax=Folsomia candida TaxID=158441 RepID=UPI000B9068AB|nr:tripartite motif-containing protein 2 isoform X3 [Folsomia candida]XP_035705814.1 tripartite motif-containing protein 2 isoform X3 [Folsomia candida]
MTLSHQYESGVVFVWLLQCSHTVCLQCLHRIVASAIPTTAYSTTPAIPATPTASSSLTPTPPVNTSFRCPICRENIIVPRGGVAALPPSFLVNQLLDLMACQRREVIPKCSIHSNHLEFCETCDAVFCSACKSSPHTSLQSGSHNVIPFAVAIKRFAEILRSKVNESLVKLNEAEENITEEIRRLATAENSACQVVEQAYEEAVKLLDKRRVAYISKIRETAEKKSRNLNDQISLIEKEKTKVRDSCEGLEYQVEVRNITKRISELSQQLDSFSSLKHPRENSFLFCTTESDLTSFDIHTSTTYPPLCTLNEIPGNLKCIGIEMEIILETRDYNDETRKVGGDPVTCKITKGEKSKQECRVQDHEDGTYSIVFVPMSEGTYKMHVEIFGRPIRDENYSIEVSNHNSPVRMWGKGELTQPVSCARNESGELFVLDTGNSRIVVLDQNNIIKRCLENETLQGRSCTGIASSWNSKSLLVVNWRSKEVTRLSSVDGSTISMFTYDEFVEPVSLCVDKKGDIYIVDNGKKQIFVFDMDGKFKHDIKREAFSLLGGVAVGSDDQTLVVADTSLLIISGAGPQYDKEIKAPGKVPGRFGACCIDEEGLIIACRIEKKASYLQVFKLVNGGYKLVSTIDSFTSKLRRPSDISLISSRHVVVVDLGNELIKQYRYK